MQHYRKRFQSFPSFRIFHINPYISSIQVNKSENLIIFNLRRSVWQFGNGRRRKQRPNSDEYGAAAALPRTNDASVVPTPTDERRRTVSELPWASSKSGAVSRISGTSNERRRTLRTISRRSGHFDGESANGDWPALRLRTLPRTIRGQILSISAWEWIKCPKRNPISKTSLHSSGFLIVQKFSITARNRFIRIQN